MTQITTTTQPGDIVVIVPQWVVRAVGFLSLFIGLSTSFLLFMAGYITEGLILAVIMLALVPIGLLIQYVMWRFYWYLALIGLIFQSLCYVLTLIGATGFMARMPASVQNSSIGPTAAALSNANPAGSLIAFLLAALVTATVWRVYTLWRGGAGAKAKTQPPAGDAFEFDAPAATVDNSLMGKVIRKLEATGSKGEIKGDTVHVYKGGRFIGIVRVIDRAGGAISPVILNDVVKQRDRLGVKVAYLATSGMFTADVRNMADQQGVKLMTV
jgi:hypothetical protein